MEWCCWGARNRFDARVDVGEFLVAGFDEEVGRICFVGGFNSCHRKDRFDVVTANQNLSKAIEAERISNIKLQAWGVVKYCASCGANLQSHYGEDGGLLRDDEYVRRLQKYEG
jgi:hypothetical protein